MTLRLQRIDNKPAVVNEDSVLWITAEVADEAGAPIPGSALTTMTLTLYDVDTDGPGPEHLAPINGREDEDILSHVDEDGHLVLILYPDDNPVVTEGLVGTKERHVALVSYTWDSPAKGHHQAIQVDVVRMHRVGAE